MERKRTSASVTIPTKNDFARMSQPSQEQAIQAQCHLPCGQPCVCSCHVSNDVKPQEQSYRF